MSALRRLSSNLVDIYAVNGQYLRAFGGFAEAAIVCVTQRRADTLSVAIHGSVADNEAVLMSVRRMLGTERDLGDFNRWVSLVLFACLIRSAQRAKERTDVFDQCLRFLHGGEVAAGGEA